MFNCKYKNRSDREATMGCFSCDYALPPGFRYDGSMCMFGLKRKNKKLYKELYKSNIKPTSYFFKPHRDDDIIIKTIEIDGRLMTKISLKPGRLTRMLTRLYYFVSGYRVLYKVLDNEKPLRNFKIFE